MARNNPSASRDFVGQSHPTPLGVRGLLRAKGQKRHQARAGREERCDDREAPDEAKRNRHVPWGTDAKRRGGKGMIIPEPTRKAPAKQTL